MDEPPKKLVDFCHSCTEGLSTLEDNNSRISFVTSLLEPLLADQNLFKTILENIIQGRSYPDVRYPTMFDNELILHLDPAGRFSLRMFIWPPDGFDAIHDHNSWGVIGPVTGRLKVRDFKRQPDDAGVVETGRRIILSGMTYSVLPLDEGIHQTGNPTDQTVTQISLYGKKQTRRSYVNIFDENSGRNYPHYSPPVRKRMLAEQAIASIG